VLTLRAAQSTHMGFDVPTFLAGPVSLVHIRVHSLSAQGQLLNPPRKPLATQAAAKCILGMVGSPLVRRGFPTLEAEESDKERQDE
jgi:hypothetical protein